jgi:hypothetical protein
MDIPLRDRPVFICGHPKSGTSLLRNLLDSHPELVVYPEETGFFRRYLPLAEGLPLAGKVDLADERLIHIFQWNQDNPPEHQRGFPDRDYSWISYEAVKQAFHRRVEAEAFRHAGDILSAAILAFGEATGQLGDQTRRWVEKSPYNERFADRIYSWWPQALCLHIVRDPRDNYLSYQRKHPEWKAETFATSWRDSTQKGLRNVSRYGSGRYRVVRYEDLVSNPEALIGEICGFLEIQSAASLAEPSRAGREWGGNSMFGTRFQGIDADPAGRWQSALPPEDAGLLWRLAGPEMSRLGYSTKSPVPWRAYIREAKWRVNSLFQSGRKKIDP